MLVEEQSLLPLDLQLVNLAFEPREGLLLNQRGQLALAAAERSSSRVSPAVERSRL